MIEIYIKELHNMECELAAQREQMAAKQREHLEEKERLKQLKVKFLKLSSCISIS